MAPAVGLHGLLYLHCHDALRTAHAQHNHSIHTAHAHAHAQQKQTAENTASFICLYTAIHTTHWWCVCTRISSLS
jgi:hypothetical protein